MFCYEDCESAYDMVNVINYFILLLAVKSMYIWWK